MPKIRRDWTALRASRRRPLEATRFIWGWSSACWTRKSPFPGCRRSASDCLNTTFHAPSPASSIPLPLIGLMSALPIFGAAPNPMMQQMGQAESEPWTFISELKKDFTVREIPMTATKIDDDIHVLVMVHPRDITDKTQYAIDQFVLRGGKRIAFRPARLFRPEARPNGAGAWRKFRPVFARQIIESLGDRHGHE